MLVRGSCNRKPVGKDSGVLPACSAPSPGDAPGVRPVRGDAYRSEGGGDVHQRCGGQQERQHCCRDCILLPARRRNHGCGAAARRASSAGGRNDGTAELDRHCDHSPGEEEFVV